MIRKQVYIVAHHDRSLKEHARRYGVTEAELIRRSLDRLTESAGPAPDPTAWQAVVQYVARRRKPASRVAKRRWTRDRLHDR
ncbi:MAG: hypothetical protein AUH29_02920 [Candidatus Rokubacteria bacterium 13_1_40CM_69_27]|nr:MAG: hypothetical protein AUH29_02920 [Candidatus Rokubacteria bacterium 13_1_40CM_69_27]OLC31244.1 MAG: hypothetical protein AUH81_18515 [Candidatus Rokubacteria bacterium 13_1_40CM_4_69_5]